MGSAAGTGRVAWVIAGKEALDIIRDRKAIVGAFVIPLAVYPLLYLAFSSLRKDDTEQTVLRIGLAGEAEELASILEGQGLMPVRIGEGAGMVAGVERLRARGLAILIEVDDEVERIPGGGAEETSPAGSGNGAVPGSSGRSTVDGLSASEGAPLRPRRICVHYLSSFNHSTEALRRVREALDLYKGRLLAERFEARGAGVDPSLLTVVESTDLSTIEERGLARLARYLPALLVLVLFSGGSVVALDLLAGEKERGTLETLYVNPVTVSSIILGKFLVLLVASFAAVAVNVAGLLIALVLGMVTGIHPEGLEITRLGLPSAGTIVVFSCLLPPLAVLTSAILFVVSALSSSFREAQMYVFPTTLLALLLVLFGLSPQVRLDSAICVVPFANVVLALREAVEGRFPAVPLIVVFAATCAHAGLVLAWAAKLLWREDVVLNLDRPVMARDPSAEGRVRRGLAFGAFMLLFLYFSASLVQAASPLGGLAVTLWVLVLVPALLYPIVLRLPLRSTLGLRGPRLLDLCLAPLLAVAMTVLVSALLRLQGLFLELPEEVERQIQQLLQLESLGVLSTMLLFAVSPAICEEILWRGTFQGEIQAQGKTWSTAFVVGLFFGLFHQSIYRFLPTAFLGGILAVLRARTGSLLPCMVAHGTYNALLILRYKWVERTGSEDVERIISSPWCIAAAAGIALLVLVVALPRRPAPR